MIYEQLAKYHRNLRVHAASFEKHQKMEHLLHDTLSTARESSWIGYWTCEAGKIVQNIQKHHLYKFGPISKSRS